MNLADKDFKVGILNLLKLKENIYKELEENTFKAFENTEIIIKQINLRTDQYLIKRTERKNA